MDPGGVNRRGVTVPGSPLTHPVLLRGKRECQRDRIDGEAQKHRSLRGNETRFFLVDEESQLKEHGDYLCRNLLQLFPGGMEKKQIVDEDHATYPLPAKDCHNRPEQLCEDPWGACQARRGGTGIRTMPPSTGSEETSCGLPELVQRERRP